MLTVEDLKKRKKYLTASDVGAVMGLNPFRTPLMVWADKTGQTEAYEGNEATAFGDDFEDALIKRAARLAGLTDIRPNQWRVSDGGLLAATCDALALDSKHGREVDIEAKTSGIINPGADLDAWGESGTDAVPDHVAVQCQTQMLCAKVRVAFVSALLGRGMGHRLYVLQRDDESIKWIEDFCQTWWRNHMEMGIPPQATQSRDNEVIRRFKRDDAKAVPIDGALIAEYESRWAVADAAKEAAETAEAALKLAMGDAGIGTFPAGVVKYLEEGAGDRLDTKALKAAHPDIYAQFATKATRRVLRVKLAKKG